MGIDVGNVKLVGQIGPPWSVSSLTQRLGRSGRKEGESSVIRIYIAEDEPDQNTSLFDRLFPDLLQATAMTELMLEKWCEPPEIDRLHLSTLIQQVLSVITERGGARADELHRTLVLQGGFPQVDQPTLIQVLRSHGIGRPDRTDRPMACSSPACSARRSCDTTISTSRSSCTKNTASTTRATTSATSHSCPTSRRQVPHSRRPPVADPGHRSRTKGDHGRAFPGRASSVLSRRRWPRHSPSHPAGDEGLLVRDDLPVFLDMKAREMLLQARSGGSRVQASCRVPCFRMGRTRSGSPGPVLVSSEHLSALGEFFGGLKVTDERIALVFEKTTVDRVQEIYQRFLSNCPDARVVGSTVRSPSA